MQIVIDISEKKYKSIRDHFMFMHEKEVMFSVKEGIPLNEVLDKIKVEIAELQLIGYATVSEKREIASRAVLQIIDKYRESEVSDADSD